MKQVDIQARRVALILDVEALTFSVKLSHVEAAEEREVFVRYEVLTDLLLWIEVFLECDTVWTDSDSQNCVTSQKTGLFRAFCLTLYRISQELRSVLQELIPGHILYTSTQ